LEGKGNLGFFPYDNHSFVLESFGVIPDKWKVIIPAGKKLVELTSQSRTKKISTLEDGSSIYEMKLYPSSFQAFQVADEVV
jgi:hypothetical protein